MVALARFADPFADHSRRAKGRGRGMSHFTAQQDGKSIPGKNPLDCCIHELVYSQVRRSPDAIAVVEGGRQLTYRELNAKADRLAAYLSKKGAGPEVPVGICFKPSMDLMVALLGVLKAGAACVPLDPNYPKERLEYMLSDTKAPLLLREDGLLPTYVSKLTQVIDFPSGWRAIDRESSDPWVSSVASNNLAYIIYTSGSTGKPRGVLLTHAGLVNHHIAAQSLYGLEPSDRVLQFSSISFDISLEEIFPTWIAGATLVLKTVTTPLNATGFLQWVSEQAVTVLDLPTAYWHELVRQLADLDQSLLPPTLRLVIVGGEKVSPKLLAAWNRLVAGRIRWINTYGPTEASIIVTAHEPSRNGGAEAPAIVPIGRPVANAEVYLLDPDLNSVQDGMRGELHIGGVCLARGYLNHPELTAEKFIKNTFSGNPEARLYKTGDMARYLPSGDIEFLGRSDEQVKVRGFRVEILEVESALTQNPLVRQCVIVAREHDGHGQPLVAYLVPTRRPGPSASELRDFLAHRLPDYMIPSVFVTLDSLPLTPNGKVDKRALPEPERVRKDRDQTALAPRDELESQLLQMWESILGLKSLGVNENFFELGGHSLLAVRLMHSIEQRFGKRLPITTLLDASTVEQLAALLRKENWSPAWCSLVPIQGSGTRPPFFCVHGIGGTVLRFHDLAHFLGNDQPVYGLQAQGLDDQRPCHRRIEDMAGHYINELQIAQPEGPYYLGGYSFGGMVALEMAHQLKSEGHQVGLVVLLDTFPAGVKSGFSLFRKYLTLPLDQQWMHLNRKARAFPRSVRRRIAMMRLPNTLKKVRNASYDAARVYKLKPYGGSVVLFRASEKGLSSVNVESAWRELAPRIEIYEVSGHHGNIVEKPQVQLLATELKLRLEIAFRSGAGVTVQPLPTTNVIEPEGQVELA
jgi:amino acid adenylation domain-containing protein